MVTFGMNVTIGNIQEQTAMAKKLLTILGHPRSDSLCAALAQNYVAGAQAAGAETRLLRVADLTLDWATPADAEGAAAHPVVREVQESLCWADHVALVYPNWWGAAPGQLRTLLERVLMPGFAFKYHPAGGGWDKLLDGRTGELLVTMDTPPFIYKWFFGAAGDRIMAKRTLDFCGVKPLRITRIGPVKSSTPEGRKQWVSKAYALGRERAVR